MIKVEDHITWAEVVASKFRREKNIPMEHEEAISLGMLGLMLAARDYDETKGKFRSFAWPRVVGLIKDWVITSVRREIPTVSLETIPLWLLPSVNGTEKRAINKDLVAWILDSVGFDEAYALERYYLNDLSMREIGIEMELTESRVSQILMSGRERAREIWAT